MPTEGKYPGEDSTALLGRKDVISAERVPTNENALVTAVEANRLWGIPLDRISKWKTRGKLEVKGYRGRSALFLAPRIRELDRLATWDPRSGKRSP